MPPTILVVVLLTKWLVIGHELAPRAVLAAYVLHHANEATTDDDVEGIVVAHER
jgi:hypothetical protein